MGWEKLAGVLSVAWLATAGSAGAEPVSLFPVADTGLLESQPDFNLGGQEDLPAGTLGPTVGKARSRVLLRFDLAGTLPAGAVIEGAILRLSVTRVPDGGGVGSRFGLHRMLRAWGEGAGKGSPPGGARAQSGEPSWTLRAHPQEGWGEPGGEAGVDYVEAPSSTERILAVGVYEFEFGPDQLEELREWVRDPSTNQGWMLRAQDEGIALTARRFGAREHADPGRRPELVLEVSGGGLPAPRIRFLAFDQGKANIVVGAEAGIGYTLDAAGSPQGLPWIPVTASVTTNQPGDLRLIDPSGIGAHKFYRVRATR
jgi:hypothetical protein